MATTNTPNCPVVIPYAMTQLATGVTLDATLTTAQTVFTNGPAEKNIPMFLVFRDASAAVNAATTVSAGNSNNSSTAYLNSSSVLQNMLTTTGPVFIPVYGSSVGTATAYITGGSTFTVTFGGTLTSNGKVKVDVLGYLTVV